jgi:AcrR family transcriptional regulator
MARPINIRDEVIVEAARKVFLERGFRATTIEVAERAGVSEGSIFKRFKSKLELFRAAMEQHLAQPDWIRSLGERVGKGDLRENLIALGIEFITFFRELMPLIVMAQANPGPDGLPMAFDQPVPPPVRVLQQITAYISAEMRAGRMRKHDPEIAARALAGGLINFVFFETIQRSRPELQMMPADTYVHGLVNLLWVGLEPPAKATEYSGAPARGKRARSQKPKR